MTTTMTKRDFLKTSLLGVSSLGLPAGAALASAAGDQPAIHIYDSTLQASVDYVRRALDTGLPCFDLQQEELQLWRNARNGFGAAPGTPIAGLTLWSDWLVVRGALEPLGWRVRHEVHLDELQGGHNPRPGQKSALFAWSMA